MAPPRVGSTPVSTPASATSSSGPLTDGQDIRNRLDLCKMMIAKARAAGIPPEIVFMTMGVESSFHQHSGGDRDSVGLFQQRPSCGWGTSAQCYDPAHAVDEFIKHAEQYKGQFGSSPADLGAWCQKVQGSAFPDRYQNLFSEAQRCVAAADAGQTPGGKDVDPGSAGGNRTLSNSDGSGGGSGSVGGSGGSGASSGSNSALTALGQDITAPTQNFYLELLKEIQARDVQASFLQKNMPQLSAAQAQTLAKALAAHPGLGKAMQANPQLVAYLQANPSEVDRLASSDPAVSNAVLKAAGVADTFQTLDAAAGAVNLSPANTVATTNAPVDPSLQAAVAAARAQPVAA